MRKKSKSNKGKRTVLVLMIVLVAIGAAFILKGCTDNADYNDEKSFNKFAKAEMAEQSKENDLKEKVNIKKEFNYHEKLSYATAYASIDNSIIGKAIDEYIKEIQEEIKRYENDKFSDEGGDIKKAAYIVRYGTYKGNLDTGSILISTEKFSEPKNKKLAKDSENVRTFNFLLENNMPITFNNVFNSEKKEELVKFISNQLKDTYKESLKTDYIKSLELSSLENFVLNGDEAEFIFNSGIVTNGNEVATVSVNSKDITGLFRDEIKVRTINPSKPMVALTFDDGPDPIYTEKIIDMLHDNNAVGTFYLLGKNLEVVNGSDRMLKKMMDNGDEIGTHSYSHPNLFELTDKQVKEQNDKTDKVLKDMAGITATTYRPPFGNGNEKTTKIFNKTGILWSVDTLDWKSRNEDSIVKEIKKIKDLNGHVILMHSIYDSSAKAATEIVPWLQEQGYQLVTVSELLQYKYNTNPEDKKFYGYGYFHTVDK